MVYMGGRKWFPTPASVARWDYSPHPLHQRDVHHPGEQTSRNQKRHPNLPTSWDWILTFQKNGRRMSRHFLAEISSIPWVSRNVLPEGQPTGSQIPGLQMTVIHLKKKSNNLPGKWSWNLYNRIHLENPGCIHLIVYILYIYIYIMYIYIYTYVGINHVSQTCNR